MYSIGADYERHQLECRERMALLHRTKVSLQKTQETYERCVRKHGLRWYCLFSTAAISDKPLPKGLRYLDAGAILCPRKLVEANDRSKLKTQVKAFVHNYVKSSPQIKQAKVRFMREKGTYYCQRCKTAGHRSLHTAHVHCQLVTIVDKVLKENPNVICGTTLARAVFEAHAGLKLCIVCSNCNGELDGRTSEQKAEQNATQQTSSKKQKMADYANGTDKLADYFRAKEPTTHPTA
jgi:hypothetical protein